MAELFDMGEYAFFVWSGWGLTALGLGAMIAFAVIERRRARNRLKRAQQRAGVEGGGAA